ncbi:MAG: Uma2 family endonuclease [Agathobacter sp.]|nr:Uma2 family endonuclease [Agathobacter sp.]
MTLSEMKKRKEELGYTYEQIANISGVPLNSVEEIFSEVTCLPSYETLLKIEKVFVNYTPSMVKESAALYGVCGMKKQGEYTMEDYYNWPEDERIELIDGVIYYAIMPSVKHQSIVGEIDFVLKSYIKSKNGKCRTFGAGIDVRLDCDDKTIVVPDITLVCEKEKLTDQYLDGAPDFVVEVLSPSTRKKDMTLKLQKYVNAGVREYWIVDPKKETIIVYEMKQEDGEVKEDGVVAQFYSFDNQVPVGIFDGECIVDFKAIKEYI